MTATLVPGACFWPNGQVHNQLFPIAKSGLNGLRPCVEGQYEGNTYWLYADGDCLKLPSDSSWVARQRVRALLDYDTQKGYDYYRINFHKVEEAPKLLLIFQAANAIRSKLQQKLADYPDDLDLAEWKALPGLIPYHNKRKIAWWFNYAAWRAQALRTPSEEDDLVFDIFLGMYPADSIEYRHPAWVFPDEDGQVYSVLGGGVHVDLLKRLVKAKAKTGSSVLNEVEDRIIQHVGERHSGYWYGKPAILLELDSILAMPFIQNNPAYITELKALRSGIGSDTCTLRVNVRAGE